MMAANPAARTRSRPRCTAGRPREASQKRTTGSPTIPLHTTIKASRAIDCAPDIWTVPGGGATSRKKAVVAPARTATTARVRGRRGMKVPRNISSA